MPDIKEPCYFAEDFPNYRKITTRDEYEALFHDATKEHQTAGEASVWYLYSEVALENIREFEPEAKIIAMIRNPIEMVYSLHHQQLYSNYEDVEDFKEAWDLRTRRKNGEAIPDSCHTPEHIYYEEICRLGEQLNRLFNIFPEDQVKVIVFDDFASETLRVYEQVLDFIEADQDFKPDTERYNRSHRWRIPWLSKITTDLPRKLRPMLQPIKNTLGIHSFGIMERLEQLNTEVDDREPLPDDVLSELRDTFKKDIQRIEELLNRDLSHWYKDPVNAS